MADITTRDDQGRFMPGNPGGPGRPKGRGMSDVRRAMKAAVTSDHIRAIMCKATILALNGNLSAMRFVTDRVCGRPIEEVAEGEPLGLTLPSMRTAADCDRALEVVLRGVVEGTLGRDYARLLTEMIATRLKAIETKELEVRIQQLEQAAKDVAPRR
ncbi:MAG: hypothetical protein R3F29_04640 [Planctomycetota bacterium]